MSSAPPFTNAALAAHRFGLGEARLTDIGSDAAGWLMAQVGPADAQRGDGLATAHDGVSRYAEFLQVQRQRRQDMTTGAAAMPADAAGMATPSAAPPAFEAPLRAVVQADVRARLATAATTSRPFAERLALFWTNHFAVSVGKGPVRGLAGAFEREAIRPHIAGPFSTMLVAAVTHPAMLRYLDNDQSAGPDSRVSRRRQTQARAQGDLEPRPFGLNENLAREVLELHTLGVGGGYTQADVTAFAALLTGWRVPVLAITQGTLARSEAAGRFDAAWHQPGPKTVLGTRYAEGPEALNESLQRLAQHPSTARFLATKLARHFVADDPPPALVDRLARRYTQAGGELSAVYRELVAAPEAWAPAPAKLKTPEEFVVSSARVLALGDAAFARAADGGIGALGQRVQNPPSPAGWPDRAEDWLGPEAVWKRVEWATRVADRLGRQVDARRLAREALGPLLSESTARQIDRAADGPQAVALLLMSPEFQRR